jgi:SAM-dependent methyltransferase
VTPGPTGETAGVDPFSPAAARAAYDVAAQDYEAAFGDDLGRLPLDRAMLEDAAETVPPVGVALDLGCGTGVAGAHVAGCGVPVVGADLSAGMLAVAASTGRLPAAQADMRRLPFRTGTFALVVAFYSVHSVARHELAGVLGEVVRVLRPEGSVLMATHLGEGEVVIEEFLGHRIEPTGGTLYSTQQFTGAVVAAGLTVASVEERESLPHEHPSRRIYLLARRTSSPPPA